MTSKVRPIPEGFNTVCPQLTVRGALKAAEFYTAAFGASEVYRNLAPDGVSIIHLEMLIGSGRIYVMDEMPGFAAEEFPSPDSLEGTPVTLHLYVEDVDQVYDRAVKAGANVIVPLENQFWGERYAMLRDPFGHRWSIASRVEDLSPEEVKARALKIFHNK